MAEDTDLLPWVLGGMLALGAVAAIAVGVPDSTPGNAPTAPIATSAHIEPTGPSTVSAAHSAAAANLSPVVVAPNARPQLPTGQVWECNLNGQRVFSDTQCGAHATVRQLNDVNVLDSTAAYVRSTPRPYGYGAAPDYYPQAVPASEPPPDDSYAGDPIYTQVIAVRDRPRRDRLAHHGNHPHPRAARP